MASIIQQAAAILGVSNQAATASTVAVPANGSTNVAFHLAISSSLLSGGEKLFIGAPQGATIVASGTDPVVIVGGSGANHLTGGDGPDVIIGGASGNVMTGGGGTDVFGHSAGAVDYITDFAPNQSERIALQDGLSFTSGHTTTVDPTVIGQPAGAALPAVALTFSDGSTVTLVHSTAAPDPNWFI